jgi:hypothetical protein
MFTVYWDDSIQECHQGNIPTFDKAMTMYRELRKLRSTFSVSVYDGNGKLLCNWEHE